MSGDEQRDEIRAALAMPKPRGLAHLEFPVWIVAGLIGLAVWWVIVVAVWQVAAWAVRSVPLVVSQVTRLLS
jgi:hypothetical protein